ncbi:MAG: FecR domain-containing protein [Chryseolinea sp.]
MDKHLLSHLIHRYRSGQATDEERMLLEVFWNNAQQDISVFDGLSVDEREVLENRMFAAVQKRIGVRQQPARTHFVPAWTYRIAASLIFVLTASAALYWYFNRVIEIQTGYGQRLTVTLPDNSVVTLNGNSRLSYSSSWEDSDAREVWINGEGFFSVTHTKSNQKFVVHASDQLNVEVLGTKFNVKSRAMKSEVMLTEGKVKLDVQNSENASVFLKPGELAVMTDKKLSKRLVQQHQYTSWLNYTLLFDRTTLRDVSALLTDTYGLTVVFSDDTLQGRELSGEISSNDVNDILTAISQIFNLKVERKDQVVTISSGEASNN